jgi:hypothetical protein
VLANPNQIIARSLGPPAPDWRADYGSSQELATILLQRRLLLRLFGSWQRQPDRCQIEAHNPGTLSSEAPPQTMQA